MTSLTIVGSLLVIDMCHFFLFLKELFLLTLVVLAVPRVLLSQILHLDALLLHVLKLFFFCVDQELGIIL